MGLSVFDIYNKSGRNFKQFFYSTSDFFINKDGDLYNCRKNPSGSIVSRFSDSNYLLCNTENHQIFKKEIVPNTEFNLDESKLSNFASSSIRNFLMLIISDLGKKYNYPENYTNPLSYKYKRTNSEKVDQFGSNYISIKNSEKEALENIRKGYTTKIPFNKTELEEKLWEILEKSLNFKKKGSRSPYKILYKIHQELNNQELPKLEEKPGLVKVEDILFKTSIDNMSLEEYKDILNKILENNEKIILENNFQNSDFSILSKWNYIKRFRFEKTGIFKAFNLHYCNKRKNIYAPLDKIFFEENKLLPFSCKEKSSLIKFKNLFNLNINYAYYDKLEKEYFFFIKYESKPYPGYLKLISNALKQLNLMDMECSRLFDSTKKGKLTPFLLNNDVELVKFHKERETLIDKKELYINDNTVDIDTGEIKFNFEYLINPYNQRQPKFLENINIPFTYYNVKLEGRNEFYRKKHKFRIQTNELGEIIYKQQEDQEDVIYGGQPLNVLRNIGRLLDRKFKLWERVNHRLKEKRKKQLNIKDEKIQELLRVYSSNIYFYLMEKTVYGHNTFKADFNTLRSDYQQLVIESNIRYRLFNLSISQCSGILESNKFEDEKAIAEYLKEVMRYDVFLMVYKTICEDIFKLVEVTLPGKRNSTNGICLSYKFNLERMLERIKVLGKRIKVKIFIQEKKNLDVWEKKNIKSLDPECLDFYKTSINTHNYQTLKDKAFLALRSIYQIVVRFNFKFISKKLQDFIANTKEVANFLKIPFLEYIEIYYKEKYKEIKKNLDYLNLV